MTKETRLLDPQRVFCEECVKPVRKSEALAWDGRDYIAYFCGPACYEKWLGTRAPQPSPHEVQEDSGRSTSRDDRLKRAIQRHPQRDEPRADSVEADDLPP